MLWDTRNDSRVKKYDRCRRRLKRLRTYNPVGCSYFPVWGVSRVVERDMIDGLYCERIAVVAGSIEGIVTKMENAIVVKENKTSSLVDSEVPSPHGVD